MALERIKKKKRYGINPPMTSENVCKGDRGRAWYALLFARGGSAVPCPRCLGH